MNPINRRGFLGLSALTLLAASSLCSTAPRAAAEPVTDHPLLGRRAVGAGPGRLYTAPFTVTDSFVLSDDYFLTDQVLLGDPTNDQIRPFARADGTVEALVLAGGLVSHLSRDPNATSGWKYTQLTSPFLDHISDVAVETAADGTTYAMFARPRAGASAFYWAQLSSSGTWDVNTTQGDYELSGFEYLQSGLDLDGTPYFYSSAGRELQAWRPADGGYTSVDLPDTENFESFTDARLLWNVDFDSNPLLGGILALGSDKILRWYPQTSATTFSTDGAECYRDVNSLLWCSWYRLDSATGHLPPALAYRGDDGTTYWFDGDVTTSAGAFGSAGGAETAVWFTNKLISFAAVDPLGVLSVVASYGQPDPDRVDVDYDVTPPIPIAQNLSAVFGLPSDPQEATLFAVNDDATLSILAKDPAVGSWTNIPARQDTPTMQQLDSWRVQLTVQDANGTSVADTGVSITPDRAVGVWQASGNTALSPADPAIMTTDSHGRVTFAVPAVELDTAIFTVQALDGTTLSGDPVTVNPAGEVHAYLAGTAGLNGQPALTGASLTSAQDAAGKPVFPALANLSGNDQTNGANSVATTIGHCISLGQGTSPPKNVQSFKLDLTGPVPVYSESPDPTTFRRLESSGWWDAAKNDAESVYRAIRHGLAKVVACTANYEKQAGKWLVGIEIRIGDDINDTVSYLIEDVTTALHAVCGFFARLGADIAGAIRWLRAEIGELLKAVDANARIVESWMRQAPAAVVPELKKYENLADRFFRDQTDAVNTHLDNLKTKAAGITFGGTAPLDADAGASPAGTTASSHANWLWDKVYSWATSSKANHPNLLIAGLMTKFDSVASSQVEEMNQAFQNLWKQLKQDAASADQFRELGLDTFVGVTKVLVDAILAFADAVIDAFLELAIATMNALQGLLDTDLDDAVPFLGPLLRFLGLDDTITIARVFSLIAMFPGTLIYQLTHGGQPLFPGGVALDAAGRLQAAPVRDTTDWGPGLAYASAGVQALWAVNDLVGDGFAAKQAQEPEPPPDTPDPNETPQLITFGDALLSLALQVMSYPGIPNEDGTTAEPFTNPPPSGAGGGLAMVSWLLGFRDTGVASWALAKPPGLSPYATAFVLSAGALGATITGSVYSLSSNDLDAIPLDVIPNVSDFLAPLVLKEAADETEGLSVVAKLFMDLIVGLTSAALMLP